MMQLKIKKRKKTFLKILIGLLISAILLFVFFTYTKYKSYIYDPVDENATTDISFQIKKGQPVKEIADNLEEKNLIQSDNAFYIYTVLHRLDKGILYGRFLLNKTMNVPEIIATISDPSKAEFILTIPEGLTVKDIEEKLLDLGLTEKGKFVEAVKNFNGWEYYSFLDPTPLQNLEIPLEGYLYPDTYFLDPDTFKESDVIYLTLDNFERKINEIDLTYYTKTDGTLNWHDIIIMASIIEKEVTGEKNKKIVSGIFWKRLENDWRLDADATLLYTKNNRKITEADLQSDSPYNTRKIKGLPPSPICNPSIESIKAALFPTETDYWFYLTAKDGEVVYAKTNEKHEQNKKKYL